MWLCPDRFVENDSGGDRWTFGFRLRNFGNSLRHVLRFVLQRQISLGDDADALAFAVYNRDAPYLMLLHSPFALVEVLAIAAGYRIGADVVLNGSSLRVQTVCDD